MSVLSGRERAMMAIRGEYADRVAVYAPLVANPSLVEKIAGLAPGSYFRDKEAATFASYRALQVDMINQLVFVHSEEEFRHTDYRAVMEERAQCSSPEEAAEGIRRHIALLREKLKNFDAEAAGSEFVASSKAWQAKCGDDMLWVGYEGAREMPCLKYYEYGYENFFVAYALYPELMAEMFKVEADFAVDYNAAIAGAITAENLAPVVRFDHDMTDQRGSLVSLESLDEMFFPQLARCVAPFREHGIRVIWHCDGNITDFVPRLIRCGVDGFQGFQEECGVDYEALCRLTADDGRRLMIWGTVSVTRTLPRGTPEEVRAEVRRSIETAARPEFFLAASSTIGPEVPFENIQALFDISLRTPE